MAVSKEEVGNVSLSGNMTLQDSKTLPVDAEHTHVANIGGMLEALELTIRNNIEGIYIQKTRNIINGIRNPDQAKMKEWEAVQKSLVANLTSR